MELSVFKLKIVNMNGNIRQRYFTHIIISRGANNCVQCVFEKQKRLFNNDVSPHFKFLLSNERLDFCDLKKKNIKMINADSFSQPSLIIFTKGTDIFGHDYMPLRFSPLW